MCLPRFTKLLLIGVVSLIGTSVFFTPVQALSLTERLERLEQQNQYRIGTIIYMTTNENPAKYFGGTWKETSKGRTIVGVDENNSDLSGAGKTGGEKEVRLSSNQLPAHSHSGTTSTAGNHLHHTNLYKNGDLSGDDSTYGFNQDYWDRNGGSFYNRLMVQAPWANAASTSLVDFNHSHSFTTNATGGSAGHNNMQPYYVVHIWEKVAN